MKPVPKTKSAEKKLSHVMKKKGRKSKKRVLRKDIAISGIKSSDVFVKAVKGKELSAAEVYASHPLYKQRKTARNKSGPSKSSDNSNDTENCDVVGGVLLEKTETKLRKGKKRKLEASKNQNADIVPEIEEVASDSDDDSVVEEYQNGRNVPEEDDLEDKGDSIVEENVSDEESSMEEEESDDDEDIEDGATSESGDNVSAEELQEDRISVSSNEDMNEEMLPWLTDSYHQATKKFQWMLHPTQPVTFFTDCWEKKPFHLKRKNSHHYKDLFSSKELDRILREEPVQFTKNIDITTYLDGKRETHNPSGRAYPAVVWDYYNNGCSVRLLNPQTYCKQVWELCSQLQEYFSCMVGTNAYLTPPNTQGFAPHYDDIEAFALQLEGKKIWKLYQWRTPEEELALTSSPNFTSEDLGEPFMEVELLPGDLLYFPRGLIHEGRTGPDQHSLHITVSCYQNNTWGNLLEKLVPATLQNAINENAEFRKGLPTDYLRYMGVVHSDIFSPDREFFKNKVQELFQKLVDYAPIDAAVDQMSKHFIHDCLPPCLTDEEKRLSVAGSGEHWGENKVVNETKLDPQTEIRLLRGGIVRLVLEEEKVHLYFTVENSREYHGEPLSYIEIAAEAAPGVEFLIQNYPDYVTVEGLPLEHMEVKQALVGELWEKGLLTTREPLQPEN